MMSKHSLSFLEVAAILRYLYLKTAKMQHKSAKKFINICINTNISKLPLQIFLLN